MPRSNEPNLKPSVDPLLPGEHLLELLADTVLYVTLGVLLGLLAAHLMRRRHMHWSWAAGVLALVLLIRVPFGNIIRVPFGNIAVTLGLAALVATVRGRRWHGEDLRVGVDLAGIAASRTSPLDALRRCVRGAGSWLLNSRAADLAANLWERWGTGRGRRGAGPEQWGHRELWGHGAAGLGLCGGAGHELWNRWGAGRERWFHGRELRVGSDLRGRPVSIELGGAGGGTHTLVVGATGSGKTVTQTWIATRAIAHGMAAIVVDPKDDRTMREQVRRAALAAGRRFILWTPEGPSVYNPYARGGETEIADKVLAAERFTEPHYQRQAQRYLGHAIRVLRAADREVSLAGVVEALDPARLESLARDLAREDARAVHTYLDSLTPRQQSDLTGVRDRLAIMAESDVGRWLDPTAAGGEVFDLLEAVRARGVVCLCLQADSRPLLAQMLGGAIVQDLQTVVSAQQSWPVPCLVVIDEFSAVAAEHVARLFGRARAAGMSLLLGTQELSDLRLPGRGALLEQVLGNLTNLIVHRQVVPSSAELIARLAGDHGAWRTTWSSDGRHTRTRVREQLIGPEEVMSLSRGCAAVIRLGAARGVALARMHSPERSPE